VDECSVEVYFSKIIDLVRSLTRITNNVTPLPPARTLRISSSQTHSSSHVQQPNPTVVGTSSTHALPPPQGSKHFPRARNQFSDLEHDDGLLEYPEDIYLTHIVVPNSLFVTCTATKSNSCRYKLNSHSSTSTGIQALFQGRAKRPSTLRLLTWSGWDRRQLRR
jgi:hypothetical protein